jgi:hypothetical protein
MKFLIVLLIYIILCLLVSISRSNLTFKQNNTTKFNCGNVINCNNLNIKPCCEKNGEYLCGYKGCPPGWKKI